MSQDKHHREKYADPSPYPEIKMITPNLFYAGLLLDDYAGTVSEFTAVNQYLYHHYFLEKANPELGVLLREVAIVEMRHMEILAELITRLGGEPLTRGSFSTGGNYWNGEFVYYGVHLCDRLQADIDAEYQAIHVYHQHIDMIHEPEIQALLHRIILDEEVHVRLFSQALKKYCSW